MNNIISSNKDKRIYNIIQDPDFDINYVFYSHISKDELTKCWNWTGSKVLAGYGYIKVSSKEICYSHRLSYMIFKGLIPLRYQIDHLCKNKSCCNPEHLEAVTRHENSVRAGFLTKRHRYPTIEYFKKEIELQDIQYKNSLCKMDKNQYQKKREINDETVMKNFRDIFSS